MPRGTDKRFPRALLTRLPNEVSVVSVIYEESPSVEGSSPLERVCRIYEESPVEGSVFSTRTCLCGRFVVAVSSAAALVLSSALVGIGMTDAIGIAKKAKFKYLLLNVQMLPLYKI